jgi:hypothetical protein
MSSAHIFYRGFLRASPHVSRANAVKAIWSAPNDLEVIIQHPKRSDAASRKMHSLIGDLVSQGVKWHGRTMTTEDWKDFFASAVLRAKRLEENTIPGLDGGFVVLGIHTSDMDRSEMSQTIELIYMFGAQHDPPIKFREIGDLEPCGRGI